MKNAILDVPAPVGPAPAAGRSPLVSGAHEGLGDQAREETRTARPVMAAAAVLAAVVSIVMACVVPTFDLDEALYRRIAEEMKLSGHLVLQTWDGKPFYEKPPTYIWTILAADAAIDRDPTRVSIAAARVPSLCFSLLTVAMLAWFWRRFAPLCARAFGAEAEAVPGWMRSPLLPVMAYAAGLLPFGGAAAVLLDPMLTFFLLAPLLVFTSAQMQRGSFELSRRQAVLAGVGMAAAVAVKGLIGFVLPALAIACHSVLAGIWQRGCEQAAWRCIISRLVRGFRETSGAFALGVILSAAFYAELYLLQGGPFLYEFFVRQHFVRGASAMQGHGGSVLYHPLVVLVLGGALIAFLLAAVATPLRSSLRYERWGFPLSWAAATILFFSAMSTKLPNYTWPVWPAFSIALCVLLVGIIAGAERAAGDRAGVWLSMARKLAYAPAFAIGTVFIAAGTGAEKLLLHGHLSPRSQAMAAHIEPVPMAVRLALLIIGLAGASQALLVRDFGRRLRLSASSLWRPLALAVVVNAVILLAVVLVVVPFADLRVRQPLARLGAVASRAHVPGGDLTAVGLFSPTVSSSYKAGIPRQVGWAEPALFSRPVQHLLMVPSWRSGLCAANGFALLRQDGYVVLCQKGGAPRDSSPRSSASMSPMP